MNNNAEGHTADLMSIIKTKDIFDENFECQYLDIEIDLGLLPLITKPTKKYHTSATSIDHIFASKTNNNINVAVLKDSDLADHFDTAYIEDIGYDFLCLLYGSVGKDGGEKL